MKEPTVFDLAIGCYAKIHPGGRFLRSRILHPCQNMRIYIVRIAYVVNWLIGLHRSFSGVDQFCPNVTLTLK